jgi:hypothetical protein
MKNLSSVIFRFVVLSTTIFISSSIYAQWQCPTSCSCANDTVSVTCFGANPADDGVSDSTAIQTAFNVIPNNWTLYFPSGRYMIGESLDLNRGNIRLSGDGISSELYTPQNTNFILLNIPSRANSQLCPLIRPTNVVIEKLTFDGNLNRGTTDCPITTNTGCSLLFGIFIWGAENITIQDTLVKDFGIDGINMALGNAPVKDITLRRIKTDRIRRNAIHVGFAENVLIENSLIDNSQDEVWLPAPGSGGAIDLETEGLEVLCSPPGQEHILRSPFVYNLSIKNTLFRTPTTRNGLPYKSKGGIALQYSGGPVRKIDVSNNVLINSSLFTNGIVSSLDDPGFPITYRNVDSRVGKSGRIRDVNISSNWISNLHQSGDDSTTALSLYATGDSPDSQGFNGANVNDNILTVYQVGGNNRLFQFSTNKEVSGNNNKTFRPYQVTTDPVSGAYNFIWRKDHPENFYGQTPNYDNYNMQILNTFDNGYVGSRLNCYDPSAIFPAPVWAFCNNSTLGGTGNALTWVNNPNPTPITSPTINSVSVFNKLNLNISATDSNVSPVRVMALRNGLPLGLKDTANGSVSFPLSRKAIRGDVFYVQAFNQNGQFSEYTYTY